MLSQEQVLPDIRQIDSDIRLVRYEKATKNLSKTKKSILDIVVDHNEKGTMPLRKTLSTEFGATNSLIDDLISDGLVGSYSIFKIAREYGKHIGSKRTVYEMPRSLFFIENYVDNKISGHGRNALRLEEKDMDAKFYPRCLLAKIKKEYTIQSDKPIYKPVFHNIFSYSKKK